MIRPGWLGRSAGRGVRLLDQRATFLTTRSHFNAALDNHRRQAC
jgi:hypothetical protein